MRSSTTIASKLYFRVGCFVLFFVAASVSFNGFYQKWHFHEAGLPGDYAVASFERMVDGTADRPFVYRQLIPTIANALDRMTPARVKDRLYKHQGDPKYAYLYAIAASSTANNPAYFFRYMVVYVLTFGFALLDVYAMFLVCRAAALPEPASVFAPVIFVLLIPYFMSIGGYFYDYSELGFFALAVLVALKYDWWWLIPVVLLGEWNKESFLLVVLTLYPILRMRWPRIGAALRTALLCLVCVGVYAWLRHHFAHNPGGTVELRWRDQLHSLTHPKDLLFKTEETYGVMAPRVFTLLPLLILGWTMVRGWKQLSPAIRQHGLMAAAINVPLYVLFCAPGEMRDFSLLAMVFLLAVGGVLASWMERTVRPADNVAAAS